MTPSQILRVRDVHAGYVADADVLRGIDISVAADEVVAVVGPNGAGKSTLIKVIVGLLRPSLGEVTFAGREITGLAPHAIVRLGVGYVPQRSNVFPSMTVEENIELGALSIGSSGKSLPALYEMFPRLAERRRQPAGTLSGGERQMVAIARALIQEPALLILDEPSAGLSPTFVDLIFDQIAAVRSAATAVLMVEQNATRALEVSTRGYVLDTGQTRFEGRGPDLVKDPKVVALYLGGGSRLDREVASERA